MYSSLWGYLLIVCGLALPLVGGARLASVATADRLTPIAQIQGTELVSPLAERWVDTSGIVTAVTVDGFYLQDPVGDGVEESSEGIFVYTRKPPTVVQGQCVQVQRAYVSEFYEKSELSRAKTITPSIRCSSTTVAPVTIPMARLGIAPAELFERYEGMWVQVENLAGVVQGPTKDFQSGEREIAILVDAWEPYVLGKRIYQANGADTPALIYVSNALKAGLPEVRWGDRLEVGETVGANRITTAILDYNFGKYQLLLAPETPVTAMANELLPEEALPIDDDAVGVCTFNLFGLGRGSAQYPDPQIYDQQLHKRALAIAKQLAGCTILGLQETGTPDDAKNLANLLEVKFGLPYTATAIAGPNTYNPEFPLTNSLLTRTDLVQVARAELDQGCSTIDYQVVANPDDCPEGEYALFDRPPLVVELLLSGAWGEPWQLYLINNHWKSKAGDEKVNAVRREAQARHVAALVQSLVTAHTDARVIVLGDLNDYYQSKPVEALRAGVEPPLIHPYDYLPPLERYTYIFNGASQVLDHLLMTPNLAPALSRVDVIHFNANFPSQDGTEKDHARHASDHDPVQLILRPQGVASLGGNLRYPNIQVVLSDSSGATVAQAVTDALGDVQIWDLQPGDYEVTLTPPSSVTLVWEEKRISLTTGQQWLPNNPVQHQVSRVGAALATMAMGLTEQLPKKP